MDREFGRGTFLRHRVRGSRGPPAVVALPRSLSQVTTGAKAATVLKSLHLSPLVLEMYVVMADKLPLPRSAASWAPDRGPRQCGLPQGFSLMRWIPAVALVLTSFACAGAAFAGALGPGPGLTGNDTGGIIEWTPETDQTYKDIAAAHCARWNRFAGITSVRRTYGDYIAFQCIYDRRFDPRKASAFAQ